MSDRTLVREDRFAMIEDWQKSGQTKCAYCKEHSIVKSKFHYWNKQYKLEYGSSNSNSSSFISIGLSPANDLACAEIVYPDGRRLLLHQPVAAAYIKSILG